MCCITDVYELSRVRARSNVGSSISASANVGGGIEVLAGGFPAGVSLGPFENGQCLKCDTYKKGSSVWAARYYQVDVEYLLTATDGKATALPSTISLLQDRSRIGDMIMSGKEIPESGSGALSDADVQEANAVKIGPSEGLEEEAESDPTDNAKYWELFDRAERRLNR